MSVELRHIRYFVALAEELHFGRAADRLFVTQPALSKTVRQLETLLGVELVQRSTRRVTLTPAGEAYLVGARAVLERVRDAESEAHAASRAVHGEIHLAISGDTNPLIEERLRAFGHAQRGIRVRAAGTSAAQALEDLQAHRVDGAVMMAAPHLSMPIGDLRAVLIREVETGVVIGAGDPLARTPSIACGELEQRTLVMFDRQAGPIIHDHLAQQVRRRAARDIPIVLHHAQTDMMRAITDGEFTLATRPLFDRAAPEGVVFRSVTPPIRTAAFLVHGPVPSNAMRMLIEHVAGSREDERDVLSGDVTSGPTGPTVTSH